VAAPVVEEGPQETKEEEQEQRQTEHKPHTSASES